MSRKLSTSRFLLDDPQLQAILPYRVRVAGALHPFTFARGCGGLADLCMHSPLRGGALPTDATVLLPELQALAQGALDGVPAPSSDQVATRLVLPNLNGTTRVVRPEEVTDVPAARRSLTSAFEVGYRGEVARELANLFDHRHQEFVGAPAIGRLIVARVRAAF